MPYQFNVYLDFSDDSSIVLSMIESEEYRDGIIKTLSNILGYSNNAAVIFIYDSREINRIISQVEDLDGAYFDSFISKLLLLLGRSSRDVSSGKGIDKNLCCVQWKIADNYSIDWNISTVLKSIAQHYNSSCCVFSFGKNKLTKKETLHFIIDSFFMDYPRIISSPYFTTIDEIAAWMHVISTPSFLLHNKDLFQKTRYVWGRSKQRVYKRLSDDTFWYLDYYHKENNYHFEVFDNRGNHLGEGKEDGIIDTSKKDSTKRACFLD